VSGGHTLESVVQRLAISSAEAVSQVAIVDSFGAAVVHSGGSLEGDAGDAVGDGVCAVANLMEIPGVPEAAVAAYASSRASEFGGRLLDGLRAADRLGGDLRGRQSAALSVVAGNDTVPGAWPPDLRVDDCRDPVGELGRLYRLWEAGSLLRASLSRDGVYRNVSAIQAALSLAPDDQACIGAAMLALIRAGRIDEATPLFNRLRALEPRTRADPSGRRDRTASRCRRPLVTRGHPAHHP
jgi:uncharacterized Ntn-hydrolase superfamily protein